jgi:Leucine-rich repeat (LRR) protein
MKNILIYYQPVLDYTIPNLNYSSILILRKIINLETPFYIQEIETIAKTELITFLNEKCNREYTLTELTNLVSLNIDENKLTELPDSIGNLTNLTNLSIYMNQLTSLPDSIGNLTNLTRLWLYDNELTSLPDSIGNLTNLGYLHISCNRLTSLPDSIKNLTKLHIDDRNLEEQFNH